ncbi:MAG: CHAT domain-containing protein [Anaerolineales bacterium]|nr:MAG: CHAT domain-containing protein [Anaerolineales bacterium]
MSSSASFDIYLSLANKLFEGRISESDLPSIGADLPALDKKLLDRIADYAESLASVKPRLGWALTRIANDAAFSQNRDLFLHSLSAWYLARACNHWAQPKRAADALLNARRGFEELNDSAWIAACEWQSNALAWSKPDFAEAVRGLKEALTDLPPEFVPHCRLSLAFAQILVGDHPAAQKNIRLGEEAYRSRGDVVNQARCWLTLASLLRRQDRFAEAFQKLDQALQVFEQENALTDQARAHYQIALGHLLQTDQLPQAVERFQRAITLFEATDLDLWRGMCVNNLGAVYLYTGELMLGDQCFRQAEEIFACHEIPGLLADNLHDQGELNILRGMPQVSIEHCKRSAALSESLGSRLSAAVVITNLGKAYGRAGRYQDALHHLERAAERLNELNSPLRLGTCESYAALIWSQLGQPDLAHAHLDRAVQCYEQADQKAWLSEVHNIRARAYFQQNKYKEAIDCLKDALDVSIRHGIKPQTVLARRLLGEALVQTGAFEEALDVLEQAQTDASAIEMQMELAFSLVAAGACHAARSRLDDAQSAFEQALQWSEGVLPEIEWRAHTGLGDLAGSRSENEKALASYRRAVTAFSRIRQNFWQPSLAGSYLQKPSRTFDRIIAFTARVEAAEDALTCIESSKASTLQGQLLSDHSQKLDADSRKLSDLEAEIRFIQDRLRTPPELLLPHRAGSEFRQIRSRLMEKTKQYEMLKARLERKSGYQRSSTGMRAEGFDSGAFRALADRSLQGKWAALDYYLMDEEIIITLLSPGRCEVFSVPIPYRLRMALEACQRAGRRPDPPTSADLAVLGQALLPASLTDELAPDTFLLLSPHRELHSIPWAALQPGFSSEPLVNLCVPVVIPSMQNLMVIWRRRAEGTSSRREAGLAVGLSTFDGRRQDLPQVRSEIDFLRSKLGPDGVCLAEEDATWGNILQLTQGLAEGLSRFSWLHIASHFFSHPQTGRLSGLTLQDGDVWLDALRDLAPLPKLVTISACNSMSSFIYEGDEHVDLPSVCLAAGADSVVGSLWGVLDQAAAGFSAGFYSRYLNALGPAEAVAQTQRELIERGEHASQWAGFIFIGAP